MPSNKWLRFLLERVPPDALLPDVGAVSGFVDYLRRKAAEEQVGMPVTLRTTGGPVIDETIHRRDASYGSRVPEGAKLGEVLKTGIDCSDQTNPLRPFLCGTTLIVDRLGGIHPMSPIDRDIIAHGAAKMGSSQTTVIGSGGSGPRGGRWGGRSRPTIRVRDLVPIHSPETSGSRPDLEGLSDSELLDAVSRPYNGDWMMIDPKTGRVFDGNGRAYELRRRAGDPGSSITWDTEVPYEPYEPWELP